MCNCVGQMRYPAQLGVGEPDAGHLRTVTRTLTKTARKLVLPLGCGAVIEWLAGGPLCEPIRRIQPPSTAGADLLQRCGVIQ